MILPAFRNESGRLFETIVLQESLRDFDVVSNAIVVRHRHGEHVVDPHVLRCLQRDCEVVLDVESRVAVFLSDL